MIMPTSEPSPQNLSERSSSFNRVDFQKSMRTCKASNTDGTSNIDSIENLTSIQSSAHHIRHSSLDSSHASALHPINLNSKFDHLFSSLWPLKASAKVSADETGKEISFFSDLDNRKEGGEETQEELILDPHEALLQDAQEESFSTSMSAGSPREDPDFILWGNAAFSLSEGTVCSKASGFCNKQIGRSFVDNMKRHNNLSIGKKNYQLHSSDEIPCSPAINVDKNDRIVTPATINGSSRSTPKEALNGQNNESLKCQSSVGSTLSVCNVATERHTRALNLTESSAQKPLMSSEAQSCCLEFESQDTEASASLDSKIPTDTLQEVCSSKEQNDNEEELASTLNQEATEISGFTPVHHDLSLASEEVKIRAELELEIEKDLEHEIKTKIFLLSRRLEELQVLKATRHPQEQSEAQVVVGPCMPNIEKEETIVVKRIREAPRPRSPACKSPKIRTLMEQSRSGSHTDRMFTRTSSVSSKKQLTVAEKEELLSYANTPISSWKKNFIASAWPAYTKENGSQLVASDAGIQNIKSTKNLNEGTKSSVEGLLSGRSKLQAENTPSFKQDYQGWTVIARAKKFDWTQTLRSEVPCTPQVSLMKKAVEEASPFLPPAKEPLHGNVWRTLFSEEGMSAPLKRTQSKTEQGDGLVNPAAGSLKRSVFSNSKTNDDLVPSTPRIRNTRSGLFTHDTSMRSVPPKCVLSQKPSLGIHTPAGPLHKTPDLRQVRIATPNIPRVPSQQVSSVKLGRLEKTSTSDTLTSPTLSLKNTSPTHAEKVKRSASAPPCMPARTVNSKESRSLSNKQVGSFQQSGSRITPSVKSAISSSQIIKGRVGVPSDSASKRSSSTLSKPTGTTRGKWY
ncbi:hypothetical protein L7F22_003577 [Adiantum nelumboides]|nr:hypothetical protein [Adiantum nelumboides]